MKLRIGIGRYDRTQALIDGRISVTGYDAEFESPPLEELFATAFDTDRYDVAEISFSNFLYHRLTSKTCGSKSGVTAPSNTHYNCTKLTKPAVWP